MQMEFPDTVRLARMFGLILGALAAAAPILGSDPGTIHYTLLPESQFIDGCPVCGRPEIPLPLRGSLRLRSIAIDPLYTTYEVESVSFTALSGAEPYSIEGSGSLRLGGEVAVSQHWLLQAAVKDASGVTFAQFTNAVVTVERLWPMIRVELEQGNGSLTRQFVLRLAAAPMRDLWFSTTHQLTAGISAWPTNRVSAGDVLSVLGRVVLRSEDLCGPLGAMPMVPDLGLDALDLGERGALAFSIEEDIFSETLGPLRHGDLLSSTGQVLQTYADLVNRFSPQPPYPDPGLDAVHLMAEGELWFSVESDFFSERLGRTVRRGDLLSSTGAIIRTNEALVAAFHPEDPKQDYGLDAVYVWPSGEIWFSVETGFYGQHFEGYHHGDLLSDRGYVVYRALDLVAPFEPLEDLADFGLDALTILTDVWPAPASTLPRPVRAEVVGFDIVLTVPGGNGFYQFEKSPSLLGPWVPVSAVGIQGRALDAGALSNTPTMFYRCWQR